METAKISSKGQLVIPKHFREALGMNEGSEVVLVRNEDKIIIARKPANAIDALVKNQIGMKNIRRHIKEE